MAIRPVDLQLAYLAAPQNAAVLNAAQESPQASQAAAAAAFAAEVTRREESVGDAEKTHGERVNRRREGENPPDGKSGKHRAREEAAQREEVQGPFGIAGDGAHFIDVTA